MILGLYTMTLSGQCINFYNILYFLLLYKSFYLGIEVYICFGHVSVDVHHNISNHQGREQYAIDLAFKIFLVCIDNV